MTDAGWHDDGSGRERWWDGASWTDRYRDEEDAPDAGPPDALPSGPGALRTFTGNGSGGSKTLSVYPNFIEFEHLNYVVAIPWAKVGPVSYSKKMKSPYDAVAITPDIDFHCDNPLEVYEYLKGLIARV